jgi:peptidoglycan/LPS O-acetylase OafA/YrhL
VTTKPATREIELDFIRGIAILMVVDFHSLYGPLFYPLRLLGFVRFGASGVSVFFVLSGFLVGGLLVKEWKVRGSIDSRRFLVRRGFKIWPSYYLFIALILVTRHRTLHQMWGNLLNIQNYVGGVAHTWSLAVEEHAYILLVLFLAFAARRRLSVRNVWILLLGSVIFVTALRFFLNILGYDIFAATHTRIDGILIGVLLAMLYHYVPETFNRVQNLRWIWIGGLLLSLLCFRFPVPYIWRPSLIITVGNLLGVSLLMLLYRHREGKRRNPLYRFIAWIGLYSYGIYLWHVSIIAPIAALGRRMPHTAAVVWETIAPLVFAIAIGVFMTKLIEFPALRLRDRLFPRRVDSAVGTPAELEAPQQ